LLDGRPALLDPAVDGGLVAFGGAALEPLDRPAEAVVQQRPHPGGMVLDAGQPLDDQRDAVQRPQLPHEPLGRRAFEQACSTMASWASESLGAGPLGPRLPSASVPPRCQRVCQTLTAWAETSSWRATSAWWTPAANNSAARSRRAWSR
jgi:hypothetical protein